MHNTSVTVRGSKVVTVCLDIKIAFNSTFDVFPVYSNIIISVYSGLLMPCSDSMKQFVYRSGLALQLTDSFNAVNLHSC